MPLPLLPPCQPTPVQIPTTRAPWAFLCRQGSRTLGRGGSRARGLLPSCSLRGDNPPLTPAPLPSLRLQAGKGTPTGWGFTKPFAWSLWLALFLTLLVVPPVIFLIEFWSLRRRIHRRAAATACTALSCFLACASCCRTVASAAGQA
jgi:hypothetical protein